MLMLVYLKIRSHFPWFPAKPCTDGSIFSSNDTVWNQCCNSKWSIRAARLMQSPQSQTMWRFCGFMSGPFGSFFHREMKLFSVCEIWPNTGTEQLLVCQQKWRLLWLCLWVHSTSSCLMRMRVGGCRLPRPSRRRMYSLNWEESTPPPHEHVIQNPLCCNRSNTCSHTQTKRRQQNRKSWQSDTFSNQVLKSRVLLGLRMELVLYFMCHLFSKLHLE